MFSDLPPMKIHAGEMPQTPLVNTLFCSKLFDALHKLGALSRHVKPIGSTPATVGPD